MTRVFQFIIILLLSSTTATIFGQPSSQQLKEYIELNNVELRLPDFKDSELDLKLKLDQLHIINKSRNKYRAAPVKLDILASRVANKMCREAAENGFTGHWNLAGEKPYHRYAFAGGLDHISENASGETTNGIFRSDPKSISTMMVNNHGAFMSEKRPNDGHKQTVIDKNHNYVGLGFYVTDHETRYYELYIDRYLKFNNVPSTVKANETFILECNSPKDLFINLVLAYYEPNLKPMTPRRISTSSSYNDYTDVIALEVPPWEIIKYKEGDWYKIPISFKKTGLYYIHIYSDKKPYKVGTTYSSENSLQASGIVIEVVK